MLKTLVLADDFTGALDTGIKFSAVGARTRVMITADVDFTAPREEEVLVLCVPTRHEPPREAYRIIRRITERAAAAGVPCIFKKTDSALRGNVGAEVGAVADGSGGPVCLIPALPAMNRVTREGIHYINGVPVAESVFGRDPFEPVTESYVPDLLHRQCDTPVHPVPVGATPEITDEPAIYVFDCTSREEMDAALRDLRQANRLQRVAGCAGLAETLTPYLDLETSAGGQTAKNCRRLLVVCGSVNPISIKQLDYGEAHGYGRVHLTAEQLLQPDASAVLDAMWDAWAGQDCLIVDSLQTGVLTATEQLTMEDIRQRISGRIGEALKGMLDRGFDDRLLVIGGDTLLEFFRAIGCTALEPVCELQPGVVLSRIQYQGKEYEIVSKSGGFGEETLLATLRGNREEG